MFRLYALNMFSYAAITGIIGHLGKHMDSWEFWAVVSCLIVLQINNVLYPDI